MIREKHVLNHDFGFGKEIELTCLEKLKLRNLNDLEVYINKLFLTLYLGKVSKNTIYFSDKTNLPVQIIIEKTNLS